MPYLKGISSWEAKDRWSRIINHRFPKYNSQTSRINITCKLAVSLSNVLTSEIIKFQITLAPLQTSSILPHQRERECREFSEKHQVPKPYSSSEVFQATGTLQGYSFHTCARKKMDHSLGAKLLCLFVTENRLVPSVCHCYTQDSMTSSENATAVFIPPVQWFSILTAQ